MNPAREAELMAMVEADATGKQPTGKPCPGRMVDWHPNPVIEPVSLGTFARAERLPILGWQLCDHCGGVGLNEVPLLVSLYPN